MPGVGCNALNSYQLVAGMDLHKQIPPPPPAGPLPAPHVVVYCMGLAMPQTSKKSPSVKAGWGYALGRQHDLGIGMYHFAANALLPIVWLGGGNKAEFGSGTVKIATADGSAKMAVALIPFVGLNLQLDCNEPCAMPTSTCVASFNTVKAGFTVGDLVGGFAAMLSDIAITKLSSMLSSALVDLGGGALLGMLGPEALLAMGILASTPIGGTVAVFVKSGAEVFVGWMVGSPLGYSFPWAPGSVYGGQWNDYVNDYFSSHL